MAREKLKNVVARKYRDDVKRLSLLWPAEQVTVEDLYRGRREIRLHSGDIHVFDDSEVELLLEEVPQYMWSLAKVPLMLQYIRYEDGTTRYKVSGDIWQKRLAEVLVKGEISSTGIEELNISGFTKIISKYKTLIFVSIGI